MDAAGNLRWKLPTVAPAGPQAPLETILLRREFVLQVAHRCNLAVIPHWLRERYGAEVVPYTGDVEQGAASEPPPPSAAPPTTAPPPRGQVLTR